MHKHLALALIVPACAAIFAGAVVVGYMMGQSSFRPVPPPPGLVMPSGALPDASGEPGAQGGGASGPKPDQASAAPATQTGTPEVPPTPAPAPSPAPNAPPPHTPQPSPPATQPATPGPFATPDTRPSILPDIPEPPSRFHVQAGAFNDRDSAALLARQLRDHGYAVTLVDGPPYRVWVGGYLDRATAERLAANLLASGFGAALTPR